MWFYYAASSIFFFTTLNLIQRKIAVDSKHPRATAVLFTTYGLIFSFLIFVFFGGFKNISLPKMPLAWILMLTAAIFYALYERGRFLSAKLLDASVLTIVSNISLVIGFIGSLFIYNEILTFQKIIGAILIVTALVLVSFGDHIRKNVSFKGVLLATTIFVFLGVGWMLDKKGAIYFTPNTYNILLWFIPLFFIYFFPRVGTEEIIHEAKIASWRLPLLSVLNVIGYILQLKALEVADATKVIPIIQTSTLTTVVMGILILQEKQFVTRKIVAALIALGGVYLLASA